MIVMKVRYEIGDITLKVMNMSPRDGDTYVLLKASDESGNEIAFALSNKQADRLEAELYEANRRRRYSAVTATGHSNEHDFTITPQSFGNETEDHT